jgi:hypothetical protein
MKLSILDDLDILQDGTANERSQWIHEQKDQELYQVGAWLFMNLGPNTQNYDHRRTNVRDIIDSYYYNKEWSPKQKHMVGHAIIEYWSVRAVENDPRFYV